MGNSKFSFLKQWFTVTYSDDSTDLIYSMTNNHYVHGWLEDQGYCSFTNTITTESLDIFLTALNEPDSFETHFSEDYNYTLWDMDRACYWSSVEDYREHSKLQMCDIFDKLWDIQADIESGVSCVLKYHIYYSH